MSNKLYKSILFLFFALFSSSLYAATIQEAKWPQGKTILNFFEENKIPLKVYYDLPAEDKELADEIISGNTFYSLYEGDTLLQALIPINEDSQLHIYKDSNGYGLKAIPTLYFKEEKTIALSVQNSIYNDIANYTGDGFLAHEFIQSYKNSVDFRRQIKKDDKVAIIYERKYRLGRPFGVPQIKASVLNVGNHNQYVFRNSDGNFYDLNGNHLNKYLLTIPLKYKRISSQFSMGRKHPILGYKRPHLGVDYAAPRYTPIKAAGKGKIVFLGTKGGYGKTVIIQHENGYKTLYAHMQKFEKGLRAGSYVSQGKVIGAVGSTGLSTGPHLHFGLYKNGNALNPLKHLRIAVSALKGKQKEEFLNLANSYKNDLHSAIANNIDSTPLQKKNNTYIVYLNENNLENALN